MSEQEAYPTHDLTLCRCGHLLAACADCRAWLVEHSPLIQLRWGAWWKLWHEYAEIATLKAHQDQWAADAAEADDRAYFGLVEVKEPCAHCGHARSEHGGSGMCQHLAYANGPRCGCVAFRPLDKG